MYRIIYSLVLGKMCREDYKFKSSLDYVESLWLFWIIEGEVERGGEGRRRKKGREERERGERGWRKEKDRKKEYRK